MQIFSSVDAEKILQKLASYNEEYVIGLYLDQTHTLQHSAILAVGERSAVHISVRDIVRPAFIHNLNTIIIGHNHPSNNPEPSSEDIDTTERIVDVCETLGLELIDHIIITKQDFFSMRDHGLL